jgi:hypothetical protein
MHPEYDVWEDELSRKHFRLKGTQDDMLLEYWRRHEVPDKDYGRVVISRYDVRKGIHRFGICSPGHPLVRALGIVVPPLGSTQYTQGKA